jgi:hypothetical protein
MVYKEGKWFRGEYKQVKAVNHNWILHYIIIIYL